MSETLQKQRITTEHLPTLFRSRVLDYTLMAIGAIAAAFGAYTIYAPTDWLWADLSQAWYLSSFMVGGVFLAAGFGLFGASLRDRSGYWTTAATISMLAGVIAFGGAIAALVVLIV
jgi:hypothetical protein